MNNRTDEYIAAIEKALFSYLPDTEKKQGKTARAMKHSLSAGGKRIRPLLTLEFCRICGGDIDKAMPTACAIEMFHTFSLIHDDLPCMDDDDMRRGKPSCHKAFGEATALLAGDALAVMPFGIIAESTEKNALPAQTAVRVIAEISSALSTDGMIGGQQLDMDFEADKPDERDLLGMYSMKTGALLKTACVCGCIIAQADKKQTQAAALYAEKLGLAFQIIDDILDVCADENVLGKPTGSDEASGKTTTVTLWGTEKAEAEAQKLTNEAIEALDAFNDNAYLKELTISLLKRNK